MYTYDQAIYNKKIYNGKEHNNKFNGKKELYNFYGMKIFPHHYVIVMNKNICKDGLYGECAIRREIPRFCFQNR